MGAPCGRMVTCLILSGLNRSDPVRFCKFVTKQQQAGCPIILAFTFTFGILSGQIGFVSLAPVTKYVLIVCYDHQIGNSLLEINAKIVFKFHSIITKFADLFRQSSTLLLIGRQRSRDLFFNPFLAFYWHIFYVFSLFNISYLELV